MQAGRSSSGLEFWLGDLPCRVLGVISCILLFWMMLLTFVDVAGRYIFLSPLPAAYEIIAFTMPGIIFCALPFVNRQESHVTIDLMDLILPTSWRRGQATMVNLIAAFAMGFIGWRLWARSRDHLEFQEVTDELYLELWMFSTPMAILSFVAAAMFLVNVYGYLSGSRDIPQDGEAQSS